MPSLTKRPRPKTDVEDDTLRGRLVSELRREIETGLWPPGAKLPSMSVLCGRYRVSNITVRSAMRELTQSGLVESRPRSGVFVREAPPQSRAGEGGMVGLIITGNRHALYADLMTGADAVCAANGFELSIGVSYDDPKVEAEQMARLAERCAGLLIIPNSGDAPQAAYRTLLEQSTLFVQLARYVPGLPAPSVASDNYLGGYAATRHLCAVGCETIFLLGDYDDSAAIERQAGYEAALTEAGLPLRPEIHRRKQSDQGEVIGYHLTKYALQNNPSQGGKIGIFALNLELARGSYLALKEAGLSVPGDAAVVGFDDVGAVFFDPPLTTVRQDIFGMGQRGAELLLDMVAGRTPMTETHALRLPPELIIRNSTDIDSAYSLKDYATSSADASATDGRVAQLAAR